MLFERGEVAFGVDFDARHVDDLRAFISLVEVHKEKLILNIRKHLV